MKLIKPSYEILTQINREDVLKGIEAIGRICYKSEDRITEGSASRFVDQIMDRKHDSVIEHISLSVKFICDRGVTHELVRHRLASYSQESTRYCNYSKDKFDNQLTFILPCWFKIVIEGIYDYFDNGPGELGELTPEYRWLRMMQEIEMQYKTLIKDGWNPQQARSILPNSLKTEIVATANLREWKHILTLRTSQQAHPQMREIMIPLLRELQEILPEIFGDIQIKGVSRWEVSRWE